MQPVEGLLLGRDEAVDVKGEGATLFKGCYNECGDECEITRAESAPRNTRADLCWPRENLSVNVISARCGRNVF